MTSSNDLARQAALRILADVPDIASATTARERRHDGLNVRVSLWRTGEPEPVDRPGKPPPSLNDCMKDVLDLLAEHVGDGQRLTLPAIQAEHERRGVIHGDSTYRRGLAALVRAGRLTVKKGRARVRGYALAPVVKVSPGAKHDQ